MGPKSQSGRGKSIHKDELTTIYDASANLEEKIDKRFDKVKESLESQVKCYEV